MPKFIVIGDKNQYTLEAEDIREAWFYAEKELTYQESGNTKVINVIPKYSRRTK
jgi:hypothetical protein